MENKINMCLTIIFIDFFVWLFIKKIFGLEIKVGGIILSQTCTIFALLLLFVEGMSIYYFYLAKLLATLLISLLIVNEYRAKSIFAVFGMFIIISFAIYGYYVFLMLFAKSIGLVISRFFEAVFAICFVFFYLLIYFIFNILLKNKTIQNFLAEVSFSLSDKHIRLKGLIDSGNSVYDNKSHLPVVLISIESLKKHLPLISFCYINDILASHLEKCILVGGKIIYVPIVSVENCMVTKSGKKSAKKFVIGVVEQKFYDEKHYDCLLHRDFV